MLNPSPSTRAFICSEPIDMRSSFDSLSGLVRSYFDQNPLSGDMFVFFSRRRERIKVLFWDADGFVLYYKRLERGTFGWIHDLDLTGPCEIDASDFALLMASINPPSARQRTSRKGSRAPLHLV